MCGCDLPNSAFLLCGKIKVSVVALSNAFLKPLMQKVCRCAQSASNGICRFRKRHGLEVTTEGRHAPVSGTYREVIADFSLNPGAHRQPVATAAAKHVPLLRSVRKLERQSA
jgi:hypothetical protein